MTKQSRNLWAVKMEHHAYTTMWVLASTAEKAAQKAIRFCQQNDDIRRPVVKEVKSHGTIDVF